MITTLLLLISSAFAQTKTIKFSTGEVVNVAIQKPEIAIILTKQNLTPKYDLELKESFLPKVVASVEKKPF